LPAHSQDASPKAPPAAPPGAASPAPKPGALDEVLLRPRRLTAEGRAEYEKGNHPAALESFERASAARPQDPRARFNVADGLYKNGKYPEAGEMYKALGQDPKSPVAPASRFNLGNTRYQQKDWKGAIAAYRDALRLAPSDPDTLKNLELALREQKKQEEQEKKQQDQQNQDKKNQDKDQKDKKEQQDNKNKPGQGPSPPPKDQGKPDPSAGQKPDRPETPEEKEQKRFQQETGMPRERAMQLLEALQQNEKAEQKKLLEAQRAKKKKGKDW
jgi:tetratricopeptide (TPR) repeat protein